MERQKSLSYKFKYYVIYLIFAVGTAGHFIDGISGYMIRMTPVVLLISGFYVLYFSGLFKSVKFLVWFASAYIITLMIEIAGVKTGLIFGEYNYGNVLGFRMFDVPLIIGFNWIIVILGAYSLSCMISEKIIFVCLITGMISVVFDFLLEPVAVKTGYWNWMHNAVPLQNYFAWYFISALAAFSLKIFEIKFYPELLVHYLTAMSLFFLILNFA